MDLLSIASAIWRHKLATMPVLLLTLIGVFYVYEVKPPVYQAQASVLLFDPPASAGNNPYVNYGSLPVVADVLISLVTSQSGQQALVAAGADPRYQVQLSPAFDSPPIIQVTGVGSGPQAAISSANLVSSAIAADLFGMQADKHVASRAMIGSQQLVRPVQATKSSSGKLRTLIAVLAAGALALLVAVSLAETLARRRRDKPPLAEAPALRQGGSGAKEGAA